MSAAWTYDTLFAALQTWPAKASSAYQADLPKLIGLAELRVVKDLNLEIFDLVDDTIVVSAHSRNVPKPVDLLVSRTLMLNDGSDSTHQFKHLKRRSYDFCVMYAPDISAEAEPEYFCELSDSEWMVVPTPAVSGVATSRYIARPAGLSTGVQTTWLGTFVPDALFTACLMEAEHYLKADDRYADMMKKYYGELLPPARLEIRELIRSGSYTPYKPAAREVTANG